MASQLDRNVISDDSLWPLNNRHRLEGEQWVLINRRLAFIAECVNRIAVASLGEGESAIMCSELGQVVRAIEKEVAEVRGGTEVPNV